MLTRRVIPCLDVDAGRVVKGVSFVNIRDAGDPVEHVLDLAAIPLVIITLDLVVTPLVVSTIMKGKPFQFLEKPIRFRNSELLRGRLLGKRLVAYQVPHAHNPCTHLCTLCM